MSEIENDDELEEMLDRKMTPREETVAEHSFRHKAMVNPVRRKIIKTIGVFGITKKELKKQLNLSDSVLKFQLEFLMSGNYITMDGETIKLTEDGIAMLSSI